MTEKEIKSLIKEDRNKVRDPYKDKGDLMIDQIVDLFEKKEIDEKVLKTLMSIVILNLTKDTINDLSANLVKNMTWDAPVAYFDH